jgi:hypothetical protein
MKIKKSVVNHSILSACVVVLAFSGRAQSVITTVRNSTSGLGQINFTPGSNCTDFTVFGHTGAYASSGSSISSTITGDGQLVANAGPYTYTYFTWSGGLALNTGGSSGTTYNVDPGCCEALSSGYGTTPWTHAGLSITAPTSDFKVDFFVHDYYANATLAVAANSSTLATYTNIMNSSGSRTTDFLYDVQITGATAGENFSFQFNDLQSLGSPWSNIDIYAASTDYVLPTSVANLSTTQLINTTPTATPEPGTLSLLGFAGLAAASWLRRRKA